MLKYFVVLSVLAISYSGARPGIGENGQFEEDSQRIEEYQKLISKHVVVYPTQADPKNYNEKNVKFYLYTREHPTKYELKIGHMDGLRNSSYNVRKETKVLVHGYFLTEGYLKELVNAYLRYHTNGLNVITVDFGVYTKAEINDFMNLYEQIGNSVSKLTEMLNEYGTHTDNMHMIGFGFGAHILGATAKWMWPKKMGRVTGLDPVGCTFDRNNTLAQLKPNDADFVDVIMTSTNTIGSRKMERGHAQFYPNGGGSQPQPTDMAIDHLKSYYYFVESVVTGKGFKATSAKNYVDFKLGHGGPGVAYMGEYVDKRARGNFYLTVNPLPHYGTISYEEAKSTPYPFLPSYDSESFGMAGWNPRNVDVYGQGEYDVQKALTRKAGIRQSEDIRQTREREESSWSKNN